METLGRHPPICLTLRAGLTSAVPSIRKLLKRHPLKANRPTRRGNGGGTFSPRSRWASLEAAPAATARPYARESAAETERRGGRTPHDRRRLSWDNRQSGAARLVDLLGLRCWRARWRANDHARVANPWHGTGARRGAAMGAGGSVSLSSWQASGTGLEERDERP
jgi:hypothetical protein